MGIRPRAARASGALASPSAARANTARFGTGLRLPRPRGLGVTSARECATLGSKDAGSSPFSFCLPSLGLTPDFCPGAALRRLPNQWRCGYAAARWWARGALLHEGPSRARLAAGGQAALSSRCSDEGPGLRSQARARALTCLHTCAEVFTLGVCPCAAALTPLSLPHTRCPFWAISAVRFLRFHSCGFPCSLRSASADQRTPCPCDRVGTARPHSSRLTFKVTFPEHRLTPLSLDCRHTAPASPPPLLAVAARSSIRD